MQLRELLAAARLDAPPVPDVDLSGIACDSRQVSPGNLFVCIRGTRHDGHRFVPDALARGAAAILAQQPVSGAPVPVVVAEDSRLAYALLCAAYRGSPADRLNLVGVTGTNGKTSVTFLLESILRAAGHNPGLVGSIHIRIGDRTFPSRMTTPDAGELQRVMQEMTEAGVDDCILEVSSHALRQHRVGGCAFDLGIFTNLGRDHLDFHQTWEDYFQSKARLFAMLRQNGSGGRGVVNVDDRWGRRLGAALGDRAVTYGLRHSAHVWATVRPADHGGSLLRIRTPAGDIPVALRLPGRCNVYNALAAAAAAWARGLPAEAIRSGLEAVTAVPGRFQEVDCGQPFKVCVDFAHNPHGLQAAAQALQGTTGGRKLLVFGCKGEDGDVHKRRLMGRTAGRWADYVIVTTDNAYGEDPHRIAQHIEAGLREVGLPDEAREVILDRRRAIERALRLAGAGDLVLIAGKGHETEQVIDANRVPFNDAEVAAELLQTIGRKGW